MTPFEVLGLTAPPFTRAAVRRAYAAALRRHRPEDDPAGFRRVRDAYEALAALDDAALAAAAAEATGAAEGSTTAGPAPDPTPAADGPTPAAPDGAAGAAAPTAAAVRAALATAGAPPATRARRDALGPFVAAAADDRAVLDALLEALAEAPDGEALLRGLASADLGTTLLRAGSVSALAFVADALDVPARWPELLELSRRVEALAPTLAGAAAAQGLVVVARMAAVLAPARARGLAETAFRIAPPGTREALPLDAVDVWVQAAAALPPAETAARRGLAAIAAGVWERADAGVASDLAALRRRVVTTLSRARATEARAPLLVALEHAAPAFLEDAAREVAGKARARAKQDAGRARRSGWGRALLAAWCVSLLAGLVVRLFRGSSSDGARADRDGSPFGVYRDLAPSGRLGALSASELAELARLTAKPRATRSPREQRLLELLEARQTAHGPLSPAERRWLDTLEARQRRGDPLAPEDVALLAFLRGRAGR